MPENFTSHDFKTWGALSASIKKRLKNKSREPILYGELSTIIHGHPRGAQGFRSPLHKIHVRTNALNKRNKTDHPRLNSLVVNQKGEQPGIPARQEAGTIWGRLEKNGPAYVGALGVLLGYQEFSDVPRALLQPVGAAKDSEGPSGKGKRSEATWTAKQSPLVQRLAAILQDLDCERSRAAIWVPDMLYRTPLGQDLLIEVKPDASLHNVITAIGQVICYRSDLPNAISVIAAPGISRISAHVAKVLKRYDIETLELENYDIRAQLKRVLSKTPSVRGKVNG